MHTVGFHMPWDWAPAHHWLNGPEDEVLNGMWVEAMCTTAQMCIKWKWGTSISPFPPFNGLEYRHGRETILYHEDKGNILAMAEQKDRKSLASKYFRTTLLALISLWVVFF